jgi:hypothetical protein
MPEPSQVTFSFQEIAELLVKKQELHEGIWGIFLKFGLGASNIGPNDTDLRPAAIVGVIEIGLQKFDKSSNLTVDAAKVNPKSKHSKRN